VFQAVMMDMVKRYHEGCTDFGLSAQNYCQNQQPDPIAWA